MGDSANIRAWQSAVVYAAPVGTTPPSDVTTPIAATWRTLGILSEEAGATWSTDETKTEYYGWGTGLARVLYSKHKRSVEVTAAEENAVLWELENPGSTSTSASGVTTAVVKAPVHGRMAFVIEETDGAIVRRRVIKAAYVTVAPQGDGAEKVSERKVTIDIVPDAATNEIWTEITNAPAMVGAGLTVSSLSVTPATATLDVSDASTQQLTVTATFSDSSTGDVTALASYSSSATSYAGVTSTGLIHPVAAGSATVTATYRGQSDTCAVTVTA